MTHAAQFLMSLPNQGVQTSNSNKFAIVLSEFVEP